MKSRHRRDGSLNVWQVSREMAPFAEAGGIKDVVAGLSKAISASGHSVTVVLPLYKFLQKYIKEKFDFHFQLIFGDELEDVEVYTINYESIRIYFVSSQCFRSKDLLYTYSREEELINSHFVYGTGHNDCHKMNVTLQLSALEIAYLSNEKPDIYHLHDGHTGFLPAIMRTNRKYGSFFKKTFALLTLHNGGIVYQQNIAEYSEVKRLTGLSDSVLKKIHMIYGYSPILCSGKFGHINTVSENYASEIISEKDLNSGSLGTILKKEHIKVMGITNGIDVSKYKEPIFPHKLKPSPADREQLWKKEYKTRLFQQLNKIYGKDFVFGSLIEDIQIPLVTMQSRMTFQKGIDIFYESLIKVLDENRTVNFLVLGEGEKVYEQRLSEIAKSKKNLCYIRKYDEILSQYLFAAGDFFIIPSRWEPCGLTDFIAQLFGNIPIVHETGGLVKTIDKINGFSYKVNNSESLSLKIKNALDLFQKDDQILYDIRKNAVNLINANYTWEKVFVAGYLPLYKKITSK